MIAAAFGYIPPVEGALIQEAIDVLVILNALRALGDGRRKTLEAIGAASAPVVMPGLDPGTSIPPRQ